METNEDNEAEIDLGSDGDDLGSAAHKQDEGWHDALDEDEDAGDEDAEMNNYTSDDESNDEDDNDDDDDESSISQSSEDSTDDSSSNSARTPPAENKETTQRSQEKKEKVMESATSGQGNTNERMNIDYQEILPTSSPNIRVRVPKKAG
jgi:hypothetical protein